MTGRDAAAAVVAGHAVGARSAEDVHTGDGSATNGYDVELIQSDATRAPQRAMGELSPLAHVVQCVVGNEPWVSSLLWLMSCNVLLATSHG
jgi:hypothetical protein